MIEYPPNRSDIIQTINESDPLDWTYQEANHSLAGGEDDSHNAIWVYNHDVNLRLERGRVAVQDFQQDWTDNFPDTNAISYGYWFYYGQSPILYQVLVSVDGHRADLPIPDREEDRLVISATEAKYGRIVTGDRDQFDRALKRANIEIE